jgi:hypothetical protein
MIKTIILYNDVRARVTAEITRAIQDKGHGMHELAEADMLLAREIITGYSKGIYGQVDRNGLKNLITLFSQNTSQLGLTRQGRLLS